MKKHLQQIDVLKGIAIISVIALHSVTKQELVQSYAIYHIWQAVPLFMILMGVNLGLGLRAERQQLSQLYTKVYFTKKATRILVPFTLVFVASIVLGLLWLQLYNRNMLEFTAFNWIGVLPVSGKGNYFITLILQSIILLPIIGYGFAIRPILTTLFLVLVEAAFLLFSKKYNLFEGEDLAYIYAAALPRYFSALALGLWLAKSINKGFKPSVLLIFLLLGLLSILYLYLTVYHDLHIPIVYESWATQNMFAFGYAALLILLIILLLPASSDNYILRLIANIGQASYHIFLVQVLYFGLTIDHSNLLLNLAICLLLGELFYKAENQMSKKYLSFSQSNISS
ncbi:acyltransferase family protein [Pontibacter sp. H249]|uniref:acyltransferase family protein n=1 Tax=Pontibacter sp. H249 TaxID=3133420 RepID=UPI0030BD9EEB